MEFYDRKQELALLEQLRQQTDSAARMTVLTGRRRVGKTKLALEFAKSHKYLYLFITKKPEQLLCEDFLVETKNIFTLPIIGDIRSFKDIFALLLEISKKEPFTLIIDEFQEFYTINPAVYSEIQHLWDIHKDSSQLNLICIGSVFSLMRKIFENSKEPLFGRADRTINLQPFSIQAIHQILADRGIHDYRTLFDWYVLTGGMPKYIDILISNGSTSTDEAIDFMASEYSPFLLEGKNLLIEEFGKEYGVYFSILELISRGKTGRGEIESIMERKIGGYLGRLENDYNLIGRQRPITAKPGSRLLKYELQDNFLRFWFRFIRRNWSAVEAGNFAYIRQAIRRDYQTYCGRLLEKFFQALFAATGRFNRIGSYWEKKNLNEIDLVAINDLEKKIVMAEIKLNKERINLPALRKKSEKLVTAYSEYSPEWLALGIDDIPVWLQT